MTDTAKLVGELRAIFTEITEIDDIPSDKSLKDLGVDSMMALEIVTAIEKKYAIKIEESELNQVATLDKAAVLVAGKLASRA
ncbi:MAG: acyl carrier protein [Myxococcales bacterium]|jgi:acyl carrier protein|nr:acyl carrier protein [Myxococcales bacterium]